MHCSLTAPVCLLLLLVSCSTKAAAGSNSSRRLLQNGEPAPGETVTLDFFYGPECGHCLNFLRQGILPLMEAGLPGDRVKLTVLPFIQLEGKLPVATEYWDQICMGTNTCFYSVAPICALKVNVPAAAPVDTPELAKAVHFAECNQARRLASHPNTGADVTPEMRAAEDAESRACAAQAGIEYSGVKACVEGGEGMRLVHSPGYTDRIVNYELVLQKSGEQMMPYIFLNGDVLRCDGTPTGIDCSAIWTPAGSDHLLAAPGSLLHVVCSRLAPQPAACAGVTPGRVKVGPTPACENCVEVGKFHWDEPHSAALRKFQALWLIGAVVVCAAVLGWVAWWRRHREGPMYVKTDARTSPLVEE